MNSRPTTRSSLAALFTATALLATGCASDSASGPSPAATTAPSAPASGGSVQPVDHSVEGTLLRLSVNGQDVEAVMVDNVTAREFVALLPLTITMNDMLGREAYGGGLPADLTDDAPRRTDYEVGELVYWPPTNGLAVYYAQAGSPVPEPGLIPLAKLSNNVEAFDLSGSGAAEVTIELAD